MDPSRCLHRHRTGRQLTDQPHQLSTAYLPAQQADAASINSVQLKHVLCQINPHRRNPRSWARLSFRVHEKPQQLSWLRVH